MTTRKLKIYIMSGTHWDREWYRPFQGFRYKLVKIVDDIIEKLEQNPDFSVFTMDGQTVVLEDYLKIRPEMRSRLQNLIQKGRILIGPWYCMPDEVLVSGESLIKNLKKGEQVSRSFGVEPWKYGYICDIFSHTPQLPQIFQGFGVKGALLGRGTNEETCPSHFRWKALDSSECITFKLPDFMIYGNFTSRVVIPLEEKPEEEKMQELKACVEYEAARSDVPVVLLIDALDHMPLHLSLVEWKQRIEQLFPDSEVVIGDAADMAKEVAAYREQLPVKQGELAELIISDKMAQRTIINTASSRYDIKLKNDQCQAFLERIAEPLAVLSEWNGKHIYTGFRQLANNYLLLNHPHDSICGCSLDQVHRDMHYRYDQVMQLGYEIAADVADGFLKTVQQDKQGECCIIQVYHPDPRPVDTVLTLEIPFKKDYPYHFCEEPNYYQLKNAFRILDEGGQEIPYQLLDIQKNCIRHIHEDQYNECDIYRVAFRATLNAGGTTVFRAAYVPKKNIATRYLYGLATSAHTAENEFLTLSLNDNGTLEVTDKRSGKVYSGMLWYLDDGDIGDGWNYSAPVGNRSVSSRGAVHTIEQIADGPALCTFRVTTHMLLPKEIEQGGDFCFGPHRSRETKEVRFVADITIKAGQPYLDVALELDNAVKDHRLKLMIPTHTGGKYYFSSACFGFNKREIGLDVSKQDYQQPDMAEKTTSGIVFKQDEKDGSGLAFVSGGGLHECAVYDDADSTIGITLLRSFMHVHRSDTNCDGQLLGTHQYRFAIAPMVKETTMGYLQTLSDRLAAEPFYRAVLCNGEQKAEGKSFYEFFGDEAICFSTLKPTENENGAVLRLYNLSDKQACGKLRLPVSTKSIFEAMLSEDDVTQLKIRNEQSDSYVDIRLAPWQIGTYRIVTE